VFSAEQQGQQVVGGRVVADQLWGSLLGNHEHVDRSRVVALLRIGVCQVQADLAAAAAEAQGKLLQVERLTGLHRRVGVTGSHGCRDLVDADIRRPERGPVIVALRADPLGYLPRGHEGPARGLAIEIGSCGERVC
jgi:hypothetical protein